METSNTFNKAITIYTDNVVTGFTITLTHSKDAKGNDIEQPTCPPGHIILAVDKRTPARTFRAFIPLSCWPNTDDVPAIYRPLIDAALIQAGETILKQRLDTVGLDQTILPVGAIELEKLLNASAMSGRITADQVLGMWRSTKKYILDVAPKLATLAPAQLLTYKTRIDRFETLVKYLALPKAEYKLTTANLDTIMINLHDDDLESNYGQYIAKRTEEIRAKLAEDSEAL